MTMFIHSLCLRPLRLTTQVNFNISKEANSLAFLMQVTRYVRALQILRKSSKITCISTEEHLFQFLIVVN